MTLALFFFIAVAVVWLAYIGWRRTAVVLAGVALALGLAIGCGPVAGWLLGGLEAGYPTQADGSWGKRSAVILLGGGLEVADSGAVETSPLVYGRLVKALELYLACKRQGGDCLILASGGDPRRRGATEAAVYRAQLQRLGVAAADILLEEKSLNTWQNAQFSAQLLASRPADHVFLVTSGLHLRRSLLYFEHFGVHAAPVRADYVSAVMSPVPLAYNFLLADLALHEHAGILQYHISRRLGLQVTARGAGAL
jgi:uncharacterized SAM-binding protein YcdF (DUF218 family)